MILCMFEFLEVDAEAAIDLINYAYFKRNQRRNQTIKWTLGKMRGLYLEKRGLVA